MWTMLQILVVGIVIGVLLLVLLWRYKRAKLMNLFTRSGIPGPRSHLIWGHLNEYLATPNVIWDSQMTERWGPICGYFMGAKPVILITELSLLKMIQETEGNHFLDRPRRVPGGINPDPKRAAMLGNLQVPQWKQLRGILNKGFSPSKLSKMSLDARNLIQVFMECLPEAVGVTRSFPVDFYALYQNLTLDLIGKAGFGIESDIQRNPNDALKSAVQQEFSKSTSSMILMIYLCFPELHWMLQPMRVRLEKYKQLLGLGGHSELWDLGLTTVTQKKKDLAEVGAPQVPSDLLHLMIESDKLPELSIVANSVLFFEAGFETLSASLGFITHLLMTHPHHQDTIRQEISQILMETDGQVENINQLASFTFLEAVIKEGLRMYPPQTTFIGRSGDKDIMHEYQSKDGTPMKCTIPKGIHIQVGLYQILNSPDIWDAPREFRPERFLEPLTPAQATAYQPFGKGKRICIGRKYADMVLKLVLIHLFSMYRIVPNEEGLPEEIEVVYKTATMTPKNGVVGCLVFDPLFDPAGIVNQE